MKRLIPFLLPLLCFARTDTYSLHMRLNVPAVVNNAESRGQRVYRPQIVKGVMRVTSVDGSEPEVELFLTNMTHRTSSGAHVTYSVAPAYNVGWHAIGSNLTGTFRKASVFLSFEATPSYALADGEDNTLILTLSGRGTTDGLVYGYCAGQLGCGCYAYGHVSPTRIYGTDIVVDTAAVWGTWRARRK